MRLAFLYGRFSLGSRPFDFDNLYESPRGLTGSELSCIEYALAMRDRGHEVALVVGQKMEPREWRGLNVFGMTDPRLVDGCDAVLSWNEPDLFREIKPGPLRVMNQQLNDFGYCQPAWGDFVDVVTSPSAHHLAFLRKQVGEQKSTRDGWPRWDVLPNGCDPSQYSLDRERIPGRVIWASSADRGLHLLLEAWPEIKTRVPHASLRAFYNFVTNEADDYETPTEIIRPDLLEVSQRKRYIQYAMGRLSGPRWDVEHVGSVSRERMRAEFEKSVVLGYPCDTIRYCVTGDTLVDTRSGLKRIDTLQNAEGMPVASTDGEYARVGKWFDSGDRETFRVKTRHGYAVTGTSNHPLLVITPDLEVAWREIGDLRVGDHVCVNRAATRFPERLVFPSFTYDRPKVTNGPQVKVLPTEMTSELGVILGYLVSEGSIGTHQIMFCNKDREVLREFDACWAKCFPDTRLHCFDDRPDDTPRREVHSQYVISFLRHIGLDPTGAYEKRVPWSILQSDRDSVSAFLGAYFEGDGSVSKYYTHVVSVSNGLLRDVQLLLLKFGIISVCHEREDDDKLGYVKVGGADNLLAFQNEIGFRSTRKRSYQQATSGKRQPQLDKVPFVRDLLERVLADRDRGPSRHNQRRYETDNATTLIASRAAILGGEEHVGKCPALTVRESILECADRVAEIDHATADRLRATCSLPYLFDPVVQIDAAGIQRTYDLSVPGPRAFTGNGIICHNTEGFSVTTMEACASGCLPVITDIDSLGRIYGDAAPMVKLDGGELAGAKKAEYVDLLVRGLTDAEWRAEHVSKCRALAETHAWPVLAEKLESIVADGLKHRDSSTYGRKNGNGKSAKTKRNGKPIKSAAPVVAAEGEE